MAAQSEMNPFTGTPIKTEYANTPPKPTDSKQQNPPTMPNPNQQYIPAPPTSFTPPMMQGMQPGIQQQKAEEKRKDFEPKDWYEAAGIVNDNIIIKDIRNEDKLIYVENYSSLDNGCVVRYPDILCGKEGEKALRNHSDRDALSRKLLTAAKENGDLRNKIAALNKQLSQNEDKIRLLEPKAVKSDSLTKKLGEVEASKKKIETEASQANEKLTTLETETKNKISSLEKYLSEKEKLELEIKTIKKSNGDLLRKVAIIEPQLLNMQNELATSKNVSKEAMMDMSLITDILYNSPMDTDYNIPKIGKFKGVLTKDFFFAFVPIAQREKADVYFRSANKRAYKTEKYILYINDKKFIEE